MKNYPLQGILLCLFAALSWGAMFPIMDTALQIMNPFMFTAVRYTLAAILLMGLLYWQEGLSAFQLEGRGTIVWVLGSLGFAGFGFLVFLGQKLAGDSGAVSASVVMALMPLLSVVINWMFRGIKPIKNSMWFILLSFAGVICVVTKGDLASLLALKEHVLADILLLSGALCWVVYTVGAYACPGWSSLRYTTLTTLLGVPTILGVNLLLMFIGDNPIPTADTLLSVAPEMTYMVVVTAVLGVLAWNSGNKQLTPINGVLFINVVPITAFVITGLRGYTFSAAEIIGAAITIMALVLNNINQRTAGALQKTRPSVTRTPCIVDAACGSRTKSN